MGLPGPVGVHVADGRGLGSGYGLIEGLHLVIIGRKLSCSSPRTPGGGGWADRLTSSPRASLGRGALSAIIE